MFSPCNSYCMLVFVLVLCGALLGQEESSDGQLQTESYRCPTWTHFNNDTHSCQCGDAIHSIILCSMEDGNLSDIGVLYRFCMTQNKERTKIVVGPCPYNNEVKEYHEDTNYASLPSNVTELDTVMCGGTARTGQLCGGCVEGHSPPVYSYYPQCVNCTADTNNWAKYLVVSLLPTTAFFIAALVFRFRATSPLLNGYILFCQIVTSPPIQRLVAYSIHSIHERHSNVHVAHETRIVTYIYFAFLSIWNLDFFRLAYTPFCLHPNATTLQMLSLDYIIAAYPLALIILTYTLVRLHYHNCTLVVWLWRPFISCFARCRRRWDIQNSLVDAFATFLLLSYVKFLSVSFDILMPTFSWDMESTIQPPVVYYDGTVEYFGQEHLPYALLAIAVLLVFTFLPILLLCLYPCRCFQRFLNRYHLSSQTLHTFMDIFQGGFKDGTNGTRDCRYFAAVYLIIRVVLYLSVGLSIVSFNTSMINGVLVVVIMLLAMFHPYKKSLYNRLDICLVGIVVFFLSSAWLFEIDATWLERGVDRLLLYLVSPIPLLYSLGLLSYHIWKSNILQTTIGKIRVIFQRSAAHQQTEASLPQQTEVILQRSAAHQQTEASLPQQVPMTEATALLAKD